jgi:hypothetical protein
MRAATVAAGGTSSGVGRFQSSGRRTYRAIKKPHRCAFARRGHHSRGRGYPSRATYTVNSMGLDTLRSMFFSPNPKIDGMVDEVLSIALVKFTFADLRTDIRSAGGLTDDRADDGPVECVAYPRFPSYPGSRRRPPPEASQVEPSSPPRRSGSPMEGPLCSRFALAPANLTHFRNQVVR